MRVDVFLINYILFFTFSVFQNCFSLDFNWENEAIKKYSRLKILSDCLGSGFVESWKDSLETSTQKCFNEKPFGDRPDLVSVLEGILLRRKIDSNVNEVPQQDPNIADANLNNNINNINNHHIPVHHPPLHNSHFIYLLPNLLNNVHPQIRHPLQFVPLNHQVRTNSLPPNTRIWKRSTTEDAEIIKSEEKNVDDRSGKKIKLKAEWRVEDVEMDTAQLLKTIPKVTTVRNRLANRISNITCVLKSMELLRENGSPNYSYNTELINRLNVAPDLRSSLRDAQDFCREFSMCVPIHRLSDIVVREVGQGLVFLKCMKKMVLQTCVVHDIKRSMSSYDFDLADLFGVPRAALSAREQMMTYGDEQENPSGVAKHLENILTLEDEVAFGF